MTTGEGATDVRATRERALTWAGVGGLTLLAWVYLWRLHATMPSAAISPAVVPSLTPWRWAEIGLTAGMWVVMMGGMMLPSALPVLGLVAAVNARRRGPGGGAGLTAVFLLGYLAVWGAFSLVATLGQWGLHAAALLSPALRTESPRLGGALLLLAGGWQLTPLKTLCLARCRSPIGWLLTGWRDGTGGAFRMGLAHGAYCLGCCWALMGILFVVGVMNLAWVAAIAGAVLVEKVVPGGVLIGRLLGWGLLGAGLALVAGGASLLPRWR